MVSSEASCEPCANGAASELACAPPANPNAITVVAERSLNIPYPFVLIPPACAERLGDASDMTMATTVETPVAFQSSRWEIRWPGQAWPRRGIVDRACARPRPQ